MKCESCIWGRVVYRSESELGSKTTVYCSRVNCPDRPHDLIKEKDMIKKSLIYICSPLRGDMEANLLSAARYCRFVAQLHAIPFAPHLYFTRFLDDNIPEERNQGMELGLNTLANCSAVWVFGKKITQGMLNEIELAKRLGKSVEYFDTLCRPAEEPDIVHALQT